MYHLPVPEISAHEMYTVAFSNVQSSNLRGRYDAETPRITASSEDYTAHAAEGHIELLESEDFVGKCVSKEEMSNLYERHVQRQGARGRRFYDQLMAAVPNQQCPYCGHGVVMSLDHYLPKSKYHTLAVTPTNLVPLCSDCNRNKSSYQPDGNNVALPHPYFDNADDFRWLYATVQSGDIPAINFEVRDENAPDHETVARIIKLFSLLRLNNLFKSLAGQMVQRLERRMSDIFEEQGGDRVREFLLGEADYVSDGKKNSWERALHEGLASSDWYCFEHFFQGTPSLGIPALK